MGLIERLEEATGLPSRAVTPAAGSLLGAIRLSLDAKGFEPIARAVPNYTALMSSGGVALGGRTGEVFALRSELRTTTGAGHLAKELVKHGVPEAQLANFIGGFLGHLQEAAGPEAVGALRESLPGLGTLLA